MKHVQWIVPVLGLALGVSPARGQSPEPVGPPTDNNAALQYWQGFGLMTDATKKMLEDLDAVRFEGDVLNDVRDGNPRLAFLHAGAAMPRCDWGIDFRTGPETLMPHLSESRELARLAVLRARYRFEQGHHRDGVEDVLATMELAKDVGESPVLISILVRYMLEMLAIDTLARDLPKMDRPTLDDLAAAAERLPAEDTLRRVWPQEDRYFVDWAIERVNRIEKETGGDQAKFADAVLKLAIFDEATANKLREVGVPPPAKFREMLTSIKGLLAELVKVTDLPPAEQDARLEELKKPFEADPAMKALVPAQTPIFHSRRRWQARHAMLDAALAVQRTGEAALKEKRYADPFGNGAPFEYRKTEAGFELTSKLKFEGTPVNLVVGR